MHDTDVFLSAMLSDNGAGLLPNYIAVRRTGSVVGIIVRGRWHPPDITGEPEPAEHYCNAFEAHEGYCKGKCQMLCDRKGGDMSEWPQGLRVREFPRLARGELIE